MAYDFPKIKLDENGLFGPTSKNHFYYPVAYHNSIAKKKQEKTIWILKKNEQYEAFRVSDEGEWVCNKSEGLFSVLDNTNVILDVNEERISFFPTPKNVSDPWHGYPVTSYEYDISDELIDKWLEDKIIDERIHLKLLRRQI
uniref:hypothetical protein n=1 Tax=uncultured Dysgonomonas sp. TaxID=206096 RepID=UPI002587F625|nr:hypothetical protein [uncultured Dysgonomonas sp.]